MLKPISQYIVQNGSEIEIYEWKGDFEDCLCDLVLSNEYTSFHMTERDGVVTVVVE